MKAIQKAKELKKKNPVLLVSAISLSAGVLCFATIKTWKWIKSVKAEKELKEKIDTITKDATTQVLTRKLSDSAVKEKVEQIYDAMEGFGTDESVLKQVLIDENPSVADLQAIYKEFGTRGYGTFGSPLWGEGEKLDLMGWIKKEVGESSTLYQTLQVKFKTAGYSF